MSPLNCPVSATLPTPAGPGSRSTRLARPVASRMGGLLLLMVAAPLAHGSTTPSGTARGSQDPAAANSPEDRSSVASAADGTPRVKPGAGADLCSIRWAFEAALVSGTERDALGHFDALSELARRVQAWPVLTDMIREKVRGGPLGDDVRLRLLDLSSLAPREHGRSLGYLLWDSFESSFDVEHLLAFAERGVEPCEQALLELVETTSRTLDIRELRPAAFLALRGDNAGQTLLERAWDRMDLERGSIAQAMVTALALERLGQPAALAEMKRRVSSSAIHLLQSGSLARARTLALESEAFTTVVKTGEATHMDLAWLDERLREYTIGDDRDWESAEAVFDLIQSVTPM